MDTIEYQFSQIDYFTVQCNHFHRWARLLKQQSSIIIYCLLTKENKLLFSVSVCTKQIEAFHFGVPFVQTNWSSVFHKFRFLYIQFLYIHIRRTELYIYSAVQTENKKQKPRQFSWTRLSFAHHAKGSLSFVRLLTKKHKEVICFCKWTKQTKQTCPSMISSFQAATQNYNLFLSFSS